MIRIAVVEDHPVVRQGLRIFLGQEHDLQIVAEVSSGAEAIDVLRHDALTLLILDISLPQQSGLEVLRSLRIRAPRLPILVFSDYPALPFRDLSFRLGADAYLDKGCNRAELIECVRHLCPTLPDRIALRRTAAMPAERRAVASACPHDDLNARELQVLIRLAKGEGVRSIAENLHLGAATVSVYRSRLVRKLNLSSNSDLTRYAISHGLL